MNDDFNSPILIAHLFDAVRVINGMKDGKLSLTSDDLEILKETMNSFITQVLGLKIEEQKGDFAEKIKATVQMLIEIRDQARANKDWALSDKVRDDLAAAGIQLKDGKEGTSFSLN
jgi:cysteinyl-tRNA synthetase